MMQDVDGAKTKVRTREKGQRQAVLHHHNADTGLALCQDDVEAIVEDVETFVSCLEIVVLRQQQ